MSEKRGVVKSIKDWQARRKKKAEAKREAAKTRSQAKGKKVIKQVRGAYENADSALGNINRSRMKREKQIEDAFKD